MEDGPWAPKMAVVMNGNPFELNNSKKSQVTSFRMNRFNNFFQGAAALYYHMSVIQEFLGNYKEKLNLIQSPMIFKVWLGHWG